MEGAGQAMQPGSTAWRTASPPAVAAVAGSADALGGSTAASGVRERGGTADWRMASAGPGQQQQEEEKEVAVEQAPAASAQSEPGTGIAV